MVNTQVPIATLLSRRKLFRTLVPRDPWIWVRRLQTAGAITPSSTLWHTIFERIENQEASGTQHFDAMKLFLSSLFLLSFGDAVHARCETAYALCGAGSEPTCFLDDDTQSFNRWGWTHLVTNPFNQPIECTLYAGAGQCDFENKGAIAGTVKIYADYFQITLSGWEYGGDTTTGADGSFVHFYHGIEKYPSINGAFTVAPGQYSKPFAYNKQTLEGLLGLSFPYPDGGIFPFPTNTASLTAGNYFILHASVCTGVSLVASAGRPYPNWQCLLTL